MKFIFTLAVTILLSLTAFAQSKAKYRIKVTETDGTVWRGSFYAIDQKGLTLIKNRRDTMHIEAERIKDLHVQRKGFIAPLAIAGGITFIVLAAKSEKMVESVVLIAAGVPAGYAAGTILGSALASRKKFKSLPPKNFPLIIDTLKPYTVLK